MLVPFACYLQLALFRARFSGAWPSTPSTSVIDYIDYNLGNAFNLQFRSVSDLDFQLQRLGYAKCT